MGFNEDIELTLEYYPGVTDLPSSDIPGILEQIASDWSPNNGIEGWSYALVIGAALAAGTNVQDYAARVSRNHRPINPDAMMACLASTRTQRHNSAHEILGLHNTGNESLDIKVFANIGLMEQDSPIAITMVKDFSKGQYLYETQPNTDPRGLVFDLMHEIYSHRILAEIDNINSILTEPRPRTHVVRNKNRKKTIGAWVQIEPEKYIPVRLKKILDLSDNIQRLFDYAHVFSADDLDELSMQFSSIMYNVAARTTIETVPHEHNHYQWTRIEFLEQVIRMHNNIMQQKYEVTGPADVIGSTFDPNDLQIVFKLSDSYKWLAAAYRGIRKNGDKFDKLATEWYNLGAGYSQDPKIKHHAAINYLDQNNVADALMMLKAELELNNDPASALNIANLLVRYDYTGEAVDFYSSAVDLAPHLAIDAANYLFKKNPEISILFHRRHIQTQPESLEQIAQQYFNAGHFTQAHELYSDLAEKIAPDAAFSIGKKFFERGVYSYSNHYFRLHIAGTDKPARRAHVIGEMCLGRSQLGMAIEYFDMELQNLDQPGQAAYDIGTKLLPYDLDSALGFLNISITTSHDIPAAAYLVTKLLFDSGYANVTLPFILTELDHTHPHLAAERGWEYYEKLILVGQDTGNLFEYILHNASDASVYWIKRGNIFLSSNEKAAIESYLSAVSTSSTPHDLALNLGAQLFDSGFYQGVMLLLRDLDLNPDLHLLRARTTVKQSGGDRYNDLNSALRKSPDPKDLVDWVIEEFQHPGVLREFLYEAVELYEGDEFTEAATRFGKLFLTYNMPTSAINLYTKAVDSFQDKDLAINAVDLAIQATQHKKKLGYKIAVEVLTHALERIKENSERDCVLHNLCEYYIGMGRYSLSEQDYYAAVEEYNTAWDIAKLVNHDMADVMHGLGNSHVGRAGTMMLRCEYTKAIFEYFNAMDAYLYGHDLTLDEINHTDRHFSMLNALKSIDLSREVKNVLTGLDNAYQLAKNEENWRFYPDMRLKLEYEQKIRLIRSILT